MLSHTLLSLQTRKRPETKCPLVACVRLESQIKRAPTPLQEPSLAPGLGHLEALIVGGVGGGTLAGRVRVLRGAQAADHNGHPTADTGSRKKAPAWLNVNSMQELGPCDSYFFCRSRVRYVGLSGFGLHRRRRHKCSHLIQASLASWTLLDVSHGEYL